MTVRRTTWWLLALALALVLAPVAARPAQGSDDDDDDVVYSAVVSGDFNGTGKITLSESTVTFSVRVKNKAGTEGDLQVISLPLKNNRFSGDGTVLGKKIRIAGRVEKSNVKGKPLRLLATFGTPKGETGRIVAYKEKDGHDDDDDDDDDDK